MGTRIERLTEEASFADPEEDAADDETGVGRDGGAADRDDAPPAKPSRVSNGTKKKGGGSSHSTHETMIREIHLLGEKYLSARLLGNSQSTSVWWRSGQPTLITLGEKEAQAHRVRKRWQR